MLVLLREHSFAHAAILSDCLAGLAGGADQQHINTLYETSRGRAYSPGPVCFLSTPGPGNVYPTSCPKPDLLIKAEA